MRKGCDRETLTTVNRTFHDEGIATQWMTFTGHPTETLEEALDTIQCVREEGDRVDLFIVGEFGLEAGSDIARRPKHYGIEKIVYAPGDDLRLYARFREKGGGLRPEDRVRLEGAIDDVANPWALSRYPWAGANSTHHTFLYFLRFGQAVFRTHFGDDRPECPEPPPSEIPGLREPRSFSVDFIRERVRDWHAERRAEELYTTVRDDRGGEGQRRRRRS